MTAPANVNVEPISSPLTAAELVRIASASATTLLATAAVFVFWRRLAGAITAPLPASEMLLAGVLIAGLGWTARLYRTNRAPGVARRAGVSLAKIVLGVALSRTDGNAAALLGFWTLILAEEALAWRRILPAGIRLTKSRRSPMPYVGPSTSSQELAEIQEQVEPAADVVQQLTLRTSAEGRRELSGWLRMALVAGQRTGSLHVAFCPPFEQSPVVEAEQAAGPDCRIKVTEALPYGVRLDIKLNASAVEEESVLVRFFASNEPV